MGAREIAVYVYIARLDLMHQAGSLLYARALAVYAIPGMVLWSTVHICPTDKMQLVAKVYIVIHMLKVYLCSQQGV